jgi:hypothetical protein
MVGHSAVTKTSSKYQATIARKARAKGFSTSVYKKKKGWGVSVTR